MLFLGEHTKRAYIVVVFVIVFATAWTLLIYNFQNVLLDKACRVNLNYPDTVCDRIAARQIANYTKEDDAVQKVTADIGIWQSALFNALPIVVVIFMGSWSDKHGRKWGFLLPVVGSSLSTLIILIAWYCKWTAELTAALYTLPIALSGSNPLIQMTMYSYMADITTPDKRTFFTGLVLVIWVAGQALGNSVGGALYSAMGIWVFVLMEVLELAAFLYGFFLITDVERVQMPDARPTTVVTLRQKCSRGFEHFSDVAKCALKEREDRNRTKLLLLLLASTLSTIPLEGQTSVIYYFTRTQLGWDATQYGFFNGISIVIAVVGTGLVMVPYLKFHFSDMLLCTISSTSGLLTNTMTPFIHQNWLMYLAAAAGAMKGIYVFIVKSKATKMVMSDEVGKVNSLFSCSDTVAPLLSNPIYNAIYASTVTTYPGAFFFFSTSLLIPSTIIFTWVYLSERKYKELISEEVVSVADSTNTRVSDID